MNPALKLYYNNLPKLWGNYTKDDFKISKQKYEELANKLTRLPTKPTIIFMQNACKLFVPKMMDSYNIGGVDFKEYFDSTFNKSDKYEIPQTKDIVCVYNVGLEKALNESFASQLLKGLVEEIKNSEAHALICSHMSYTEFYKRYQIEIPNKLSIQEKQEEGFL